MAFLADERLADGKAVDTEMLRNLVQFMRMFAEQCHHGKEEQYLFPALTKNPVPHTRRVLKTLESEHRRVHTLTNGLAQAVAGYVLDPVAGREPVATIFRDIAAFYPRHI
jgi:hemerythrin-like domain-containing protein